MQRPEDDHGADAEGGDGTEDEWDDLLDISANFSGVPRCCTSRPRRTRPQPGGRCTSATLFDSHCHAKEGKLEEFAQVRAQVAIMGTHEGDWTTVGEACMKANAAVPAFGLHPWFAHRAGQGWEEQLREFLVCHPHALVGEIGLDKVARTKETGRCEFGAQQRAFHAQLGLAHELVRPASVHCVQAWGKVAEQLRACTKEGALPPALAMHSWGGPPEWVALLSAAAGPACPVYFGFSDVVNNRGGETRRQERLQANIRAVPDDRLLLESDLDAPERLDRSLSDICMVVSKVKGWTFERTAHVTSQNAVRFVAAGEAARTALPLSSSDDT